MKIKILACILAVLTVLSVFPMTVAAATVSVTSDGFRYTTDENGNVDAIDSNLVAKTISGKN